MSLHRYLYGNNDPINMVDPSGKMSLNQALVTTALLNTALGIAVHQNFTGLQDAYVMLAEHVFPDVYTVGINGSIPMGAYTVLNYLNAMLPVP